MQEQISKSIKRLLLQLVLIYSALAILLSIGVITLYSQTKNSMANVLTASLEQNLVVRDLREATLILNKIVPKHFEGVVFVDGAGKPILKFPQELGNDVFKRPSLFTFTLVKAVGAGDSTSMGNLIFIYEPYEIFISLIGFWLLGILFFAPVFSFFKKQIVKKHNEELIQNQNLTIMTIAKQVSHDIRSPLTALNMILSQLSQVPEAQRLIIRNSVNRINDIANQLLEKGKVVQGQTPALSKSSGVESSPPKLSVQLLSPLIDGIVSEKRIQFREKQGVEIEADIAQGYGLFANINPTELKRTISNLLNNAVEAFPEGKGKVVVSIRGYDELVSIIVRDNGKGIPTHILKKLGELGVSHGKEGTQSGSGLGIYHAKKTVESFGGKFDISSKEGMGSIISLHFPRAKAPNWFVERLELRPDTQVVSLDDDLSIHNIWKGRFESKRVEGAVQLMTFTSGAEFKSWFSESKRGEVGKALRLYLVDFELLNQKETGLDIIEELGIGTEAILVTSRYEEDPIRHRCEKLGVKLIPKNMAGFVPIEVEKPQEHFDAILIDDDSLVEMTWRMAADEKKKKLLFFSTPDEFFKRGRSYNLETPIYVDSNLANGIKGEEISKKIFEVGFKNIYLCTGYQATDFPPMAWIKKVVGKEPPW